MTSARNIQPRMLTQASAAEYCGIGVKAFKAVCPVAPTQLRNGLMRYDKLKIDAWLDSISDEGLPAEVDWLERVYSRNKEHDRQRGAYQRTATIYQQT